MEYKELVDCMIEPKTQYLLNMGAGKLSKRFRMTRQEIVDAKKEAREYLRSSIKLSDNRNNPKILLIDIETAPLRAYIWQKEVWGANVSSERVISEWFMLTWAAKWLFSDEIVSMKLTGEEAKKENDSRLIRELWQLLDTADIVIAHNGIRFDSPNISTRFLLNGLPPCKPYRQIDTMLVARKQFGFTHNNLNGLAKLFGLDLKIETKFELWSRCLNGEDSALLEMEIYNRHDTELLEQVYLKLRPWIKNHPNVNTYTEDTNMVCAVCGSKNLVETNNFYYTNLGKYPIYKCECGANNSHRHNILTKEKRDNLLLSR